VDCLHKEMHLHQDSFNLEYATYSKQNGSPVKPFGFAGFFNLR
jgi:hypothetical protein